MTEHGSPSCYWSSGSVGIRAMRMLRISYQIQSFMKALVPKASIWLLNLQILLKSLYDFNKKKFPSDSRKVILFLFSPDLLWENWVFVYLITFFCLNFFFLTDSPWYLHTYYLLLKILILIRFWFLREALRHSIECQVIRCGI